MKCRENENKNKVSWKSKQAKNGNDYLRKTKEKVKKEERPSQGI